MTRLAIVVIAKLVKVLVPIYDNTIAMLKVVADNSIPVKNAIVNGAPMPYHIIESKTLYLVEFFIIIQ